MGNFSASWQAMISAAVFLPFSSSGFAPSGPFKALLGLRRGHTPQNPPLGQTPKSVLVWARRHTSLVIDYETHVVGVVHAHEHHAAHLLTDPLLGAGGNVEIELRSTVVAIQQAIGYGHFVVYALCAETGRLINKREVWSYHEDKKVPVRLVECPRDEME